MPTVLPAVQDVEGYCPRNALLALLKPVVLSLWLWNFNNFDGAYPQKFRHNDDTLRPPPSLSKNLFAKIGSKVAMREFFEAGIAALMHEWRYIFRFMAGMSPFSPVNARFSKTQIYLQPHNDHPYYFKGRVNAQQSVV